MGRHRSRSAVLGVHDKGDVVRVLIRCFTSVASRSSKGLRPLATKNSSR
eukprot:CAMPEP_0195076080 /NCGR_PEP_ID=MMETSP0448-20130528/18809_1 /TAXON_ID=66468 /ORGANISM="Heterocapsa triquestra, Strain CCMP 448" /LENGTH=48 /DNA_ID= /DNA_START= /DNA_END= /DNA_ORIENTATION=